MSSATRWQDAEDLAGRRVVLGIGNSLMCDDGVGIWVAQRLLEHISQDPSLGSLLVTDRQTADLGLMRLFRSGAEIIVVDAVDCGAPPGAIFRFTPDEAGITSLRSNNIHGMGVGFLVANARLAGSSPDVTILGVQVGCVAPEPDRLTPQAEQAAEEVVRMIEAETRASTASHRQGTGALSEIGV